MKKVLFTLITITLVLGITGASWAYSVSYSDAITPASPIWMNPPHATGVFGYDVYDFTADSTAPYVMETTTSQQATYLYLFDRVVNPSGAPPAADYVASGAGATGITFDLTTGQTYSLITTTINPFTQTSFSNTISDSVVPIPGAVWLFASGLFALVGFRKRFLNNFCR